MHLFSIKSLRAFVVTLFVMIFTTPAFATSDNRCVEVLIGEYLPGFVNDYKVNHKIPKKMLKRYKIFKEKGHCTKSLEEYINMASNNPGLYAPKKTKKKEPAPDDKCVKRIMENNSPSFIDEYKRNKTLPKKIMKR